MDEDVGAPPSGRTKFEALVREMCQALGAGNGDEVLRRGTLDIEGFEIMVVHLPADENAMYLNFHFGILTAGKTTHGLYQLLTSNITLYAQDQAQLGTHPDTGGALLIVRIPMTDEVTGDWLAETFVHYSEHGRHWRQTLHQATDEQYHDGPPEAHFVWMKA